MALGAHTHAAALQSLDQTDAAAYCCASPDASASGSAGWPFRALATAKHAGCPEERMPVYARCKRSPCTRSKHRRRGAGGGCAAANTRRAFSTRRHRSEAPATERTLMLPARPATKSSSRDRRPDCTLLLPQFTKSRYTQDTDVLFLCKIFFWREPPKNGGSRRRRS